MDLDKLLVENVWRLEYDEWCEELQKRRLKSVEEFDLKNQPKYDWFYMDNCWGEVNGKLSIQYFDLLQELKVASPLLYEKYGKQAIAVLEFGSYFYATKEQYIEYRKSNPDIH